MITLKVAFKKKLLFIPSPIIKEKSLFFDFNLGALEYATEKLLKIDLWELSNHNHDYDLNLSLIYAAYYQACMARFKKPKYTIHHAVYWVEYMSKSENDKMIQAISDLMGKMTKKSKTGKEGEKKK